MGGLTLYTGTFSLGASKYTQTYSGSGGTYSLNITPLNFNANIASAAPSASAPVAPPAAPVSVAPDVPEPSLAGQTWGWPIPITAGRRTIPGRPVETRLTKGGDGHYILDTLVSFGWRAEIMAGHAPLSLTIRKLLINGVVTFDAESGFIAPGVSLTFYDGTQVTADPFWEGIHGVGNMPAHVYHILVNVVGLPLQEFNDQKPDAWDLDVLDAAVLPEVIYANSGGQEFGGSGFFGRLMLDAANDRLWGAYAPGPDYNGLRLEEWNTTTQDSVAEHAFLAYPGAAFGGTTLAAPRLPISGHFALQVPPVGSIPSNPGEIGVVNPATNTFTDFATGLSYYIGLGYMAVSSVVITGGGTRDLILQSESNGSASYTATDTLYLFDYDGADIVQRYHTATAMGGIGTTHTSGPIIAGATRTDSADFYMGGGPLGGYDVAIVRIVATYSSPTTATVGTEFFLQYDGETWRGFAYAPAEDSLIILTSVGTDYIIRRYDAAAAVVWESTISAPATPLTLTENSGSVISTRVLLADGVTIYAVDLATGDVTEYPMPTDSIWSDESWGFMHSVFDGPAGKLWVTHASSTLSRNVVVEYDLGATSAAEDISLARWFTLLGDLTYDLKGRVSVGSNITDTIDSLFLVDSQTTFNRDALAMCRATGCDLRENNQGIEIIRGVDGTTFSVNLAVPERRLLRSSGESALAFSRVGEQNLLSEIRLQAIASEESFKFSERPARVERGPKPVTTSTRVDSVRIQAGMPINQIQTYASRTLDRETEARDQVTYKLPWQDAISVQPGDIHTVPEGAVLHTVKVTTASREANRVVNIQAVRLHTAQDYVGVSDAGTGYTSFVPMSVTGTLAGSVTPVGAMSGSFVPAGVVGGSLAGSVTPTGSFSGTFTGAVAGTLSGSVVPIGSMSGTFSVPTVTGTLAGSVAPTGSLSGTFNVTLFALSDLANLQALWDADSIAGADNSSIGATAIIDSSGNSRNSTAVSGGPATLRTAFLNGHNAISAGGQYSVPNFMSGYTQGTLFWVAKTATDNSTNSPPFAFNGSGGTTSHYPYSDNHIYMYPGTSSRIDLGAVGTGVLNAWHIVTVRTSGSVLEFRVNGSVLYTSGTNTVAFTTTPKFFTGLSGSNFLGHIANVGMYSTAHSQADCQKIEGYLAHRYWGAGALNPLPGGHPYKTTPP